MNSQTSVATWRPVRVSERLRDLLGAAGVALLLLAIQAAQGFPSLFNIGNDNDAMMRLSEIRDLLAGQDWFDLYQYRMGVEGGFLVHWSRVVDAPIAALMLLATAVTGDRVIGEMVGETLWPTLLLFGVVFLLLRATRKLAGPDAYLPTLVVATISLNLISMFTPRSLDHHNLQLLLALATLTLLLSPGRRAAAGAGLCCALMLAVGLETMPYIAIGGACVSIAFLLDRPASRESAIGFGLGFAVSAILMLLATVPYQSWWSPQCDAYSAGLGVAAVGAGLGLALLAALMPVDAGIRPRAIALGILATVFVGALVVLVPECFRGPYSSLDPKLQKYWIDQIVEAQPFWRTISLRPDLTLQNYATPFLGAGVLIWSLLRGPVRREAAIIAAFLGGAILVSIWQLRGANFSVPLAIIPLSAWIATARRDVEKGIPGATTRMILAWPLSLNLVWALAAHEMVEIIRPQPASNAQSAKTEATIDAECYADATYSNLAHQPAATVLTVSNLGAHLLATTPHRTLAGPSHRNFAGNKLALDAFMGSSDKAHAIMRREKVGLLAFCPANAESTMLADSAPDGFMADLIAAKIPAWLEPLPETMAGPLKLYSVR